MKVSVVIPVYNVERYLERCVQSVLRQTYKDLEIILVDDGSTDGSGELCDKIAERDSRVRVIHQENQGLSGARNTGIHQATGEYVIFMDSDDEWLLDNGLEVLLQKDTIGIDLILFKNVDIWKDGRRTCSRDYDFDITDRISDAKAIFKHLVATQQFRMSACFLLVRKGLLVDNEIYFPIGYFSEDVYWSLNLWQHTNTVTIQNLYFYGYHHHGNSISTTPSIRVYESYDKIFSYWKEQCYHNCINAPFILVYLADLWVNRGYHYHTLQAKDKQEALNILKRHSDLLNYANTPKSKRVAKLVSIFGVINAIAMLGIYWQLRTCYKKHAV
jgi:glycosyltransferase involved in cell wall biosynthesis